jgi:cysteinyl-tRNA synthetase
MNLHLHNSLSRQKELLTPIDPSCVSMYVCGPTVYDSPHIGNARSVVVYDTLYRLLTHIYGREHVKYVRNITDVDDKINDRAKELGITIRELTQETTKGFHQDMEYLNCLSPNIEPRATEHIDDMIKIIESLLKANHAYISDNHIYFDVTSYKDYGKLSGRHLEDMLAGVRIEVEESKRHPGDFVLWKPADREDDPSSVFESPWGRGRPGWHIECSAMSHRFLGENFDIHGGGADLIFPHHTNEIAQSCCGFPGSSFAKMWVHNGFLTVNGEKMSKSLGNFVTVQDLKKRGVKGEIIRYLLLSTHYRKPLDFNDKAIYDATESLNYLYRVIGDVATSQKALDGSFIDILCDEVNTPEALSWLHEKAKEAHKSGDIALASAVKTCAQMLGLLNFSAQEWFMGDEDATKIEELIESRRQAKAARDFAVADKIRADLLSQGVMLEDSPDGRTSWRRA